MRFPFPGRKNSAGESPSVTKPTADKSTRRFKRLIDESRKRVEDTVHEWIAIDTYAKHPIAMKEFLSAALENEGQSIRLFTGETDVLRIDDESIQIVQELMRGRIIDALFIGDPKITSWGKILLTHPGENVTVRAARMVAENNQHFISWGEAFISSDNAPFLKEKARDFKGARLNLSFHDPDEVKSLHETFNVHAHQAQMVRKD